MSSAGPEHIYRPPRVQPKQAALESDNFTTDLPTRSTIRPVLEHQGRGCNIDDIIADATANCIKAFEDIQKACRASGKKFFDKSFYYGDRNNMYPPGSPDDCTVTEPTLCRRLVEFKPKVPLFSDGAEASDIDQGAIGDCFLIGAIAALASCTAQHMNPVGRLFVASDPQLGMFGLVFFKHTAAEWVIIDDFIAVDEANDPNRPLYAQSSDDEVWPMLIEKAYAKLHGCWDTIDGGIEREAIADMTGGKEYSMSFVGAEKNMTYDLFATLVNNPLVIVGCSVGAHIAECDEGSAGREGETPTILGLYKGHAYSVIGHVRASDGQGFIRVRNPWGNDAEWKGPFADNDRAWKDHPQYAKEIHPEFKDDGAFWMCWEDFKKYFTDVDVCEFFDSSHIIATQYGRSGFSTGPSQTFVIHIADATTSARNGNAAVVAQVPVVVSVGQDDPRMLLSDHKKAKQGVYATLRFRLQPLSREPKADLDDVKACSQGNFIESRRVASRQVDIETDLAPGWYAAVVTLANTKEGTGFYVQCVAPSNVAVSMYRLDDKAGTLVAAGKMDHTHDQQTIDAHHAGRNAGKGGTAWVISTAGAAQSETASEQPPSPAGGDGGAPAAVPTPPAVAPPPVLPPAAPVAPKPTPALEPATPAVRGDVNPSAFVARDDERVIRGKGPEYIYRQPRCTPTTNSLIPTCATFPEATASFIKPMRTRTGVATTVGLQLDEAAKACAATAQRVIDTCEKTGRKFVDKSFGYSERRNLYPNGSPDDCTVAEPHNVMRLSDLFPGDPLFGAAPSENDMIQGQIGDCFFVGSVAALACCRASHLDPIKRLFPCYSEKWGVYGVLFFKNGAWEWVIVDDFIAVDTKNKNLPLYADCEHHENWPYIVEKAYAKIHGCWDSIDGGLAHEALADLTAGREYSLKLTESSSFDDFRSLVDDPLTVMCCSVNANIAASNSVGHAGEAGAVYGLFKGHCYSVVGSRQCSDGAAFLRVRNPWGNDAEWTGPYSDNSAEWKRNPLHMKEIAPNFAPDGCFWMRWEDFRKYFTDIDVCHHYDPTWEVVSMFGNSRDNAGKQAKLSAAPDQTFIIRIDTDNGGVVKTVVALGQEDPKVLADHAKVKSQPYALMRFALWKLNDEPKDAADLAARCLGQEFDTSDVYGRQQSLELTLEPGLYCAVPHFSKCPVGTGYYIRAFAPPQCSLKMYRLDDPATVYSTGLVNPVGANTTKSKGAVRRAPRPPPKSDSAADKSSGFVQSDTPNPRAAALITAAAAPRPPSSVVTFNNSGGFSRAVHTAFELADPWHRGHIDRRMAEQAFAHLLMHSDVGTAFSNAVAQRNPMDQRSFEELVAELLKSKESS